MTNATLPPPPADPRLGRLPEFDDESRRYTIAPVLAAEGITKPRSYTWSEATILSQGQTGRCVGFAAAGELGARPVRWPATAELADMLYRLACLFDAWSGNDNYDPQFGTSVLAMMKVLKALNFIPEYRWGGAGSGTPLEDGVLTVGYKGPILLGTDWLNSMMIAHTDGEVSVNPTSGVGGGHGYVWNGVQIVWTTVSLPASPTFTHVNQSKARAKFLQSWGPDWGLSGKFWMTFEALDWLLQRNAEIAIPMIRQRTS